MISAGRGNYFCEKNHVRFLLSLIFCFSPFRVKSPRIWHLLACSSPFVVRSEMRLKDVQRQLLLEEKDRTFLTFLTSDLFFLLKNWRAD
jgi:hypothetical protein